MRTNAVLTYLVIALLVIGMIDLGEAAPAKRALQFSDWGSYRAVDFQGKSYFLGYDSGYLLTHSDAKTLPDDHMALVLRDSNLESRLKKNSALILGDGLQLRIKGIDVPGNKIYLVLGDADQILDSKVVQPSTDSSEVGSATYTFKGYIGAHRTILIAVHFKQAFIENGVSVATVNGVWQISAKSLAPIPADSMPKCSKSCIMAGKKCCDGLCVNTKTNSKNCGKCGKDCGKLKECINGNCVYSIHPGGACNDWKKCLGGSGDDYALSIQQTIDGGYIMAGRTNSKDGDVRSNHGGFDAWVVKLDKCGAIKWQKCLGGSGDDGASSIKQTSDGGYVFAGLTNSNNGDVSGNHGDYDIWVVKIDPWGAMEWQKCLGGSGSEMLHGFPQIDMGYWSYATGGNPSILQLQDGGYLVAGSTSSKDGDVSGNHACNGASCNLNGTIFDDRTHDFWIVKLSLDGIIQWQKCLGGIGNEVPNCIQQTPDGGSIVAGWTGCQNGDVIGLHGHWDGWLVKLNKFGVVQWKKCMGGLWPDELKSVQITTDGGYIVTGYTESNDVCAKDNKDFISDQMWIGKLDNYGTPQWEKCMGGAGIREDDGGLSVQRTKDGGYLVAGFSEQDPMKLFDVWIVKLDPSGGVQWQKRMGGTRGEIAESILQTDDSGYIVASITESNDGDVHGNHGGADVWVIKMPPS